MPMDIFALLGMLLTVALVLVLAYVCTKFLPRARLGRFRSQPNQGKMQVLDQLVMGSELRLVLVQVGTRYLLLGLSSGGISQLTELTAEEAALWGSKDDPDAPSTGAPPSFKASFLEALKQKRK